MYLESIIAIPRIPLHVPRVNVNKQSTIGGINMISYLGNSVLASHSKNVYYFRALPGMGSEFVAAGN